MRTHPSVNVGPNEAMLRLDPRAEKRYQQLWLGITRRTWRSIVLVPADPGGSAAEVARCLAAVGKELCEVPVTAIALSSLEYGSTLALAELQQRMEREQEPSARRAALVEVTATTLDRDAPESASIPHAIGGEALALSPAARLVIAIPAVISEPLGGAVARHADAVVVCVERGRTRAADVRLTAELIGRERIAGCLLVE